MDNLRNQNDIKLSALEDDVLKELQNDDESKDQEDTLEGLKRLAELDQPRTLVHFQNLFKKYFPNAETASEEFAKIITEVILVHLEIVNTII